MEWKLSSDCQNQIFKIKRSESKANKPKKIKKNNCK